MKDKKIVYYTDPINDDFAENLTKHFQIDDNFKYIHKNIFFRFFSFIIYFFIATPLFYLFLKIKYHIRIYNKKAVKQLKNTGYFVYGNHTQNIIDAYTNHMMLFNGRKGHIIANNDVYSLKAIKPLIDMLGTLPTPNNMVQSKKLLDAITYYINKKDIIVIYPEAHVWPYYNDIRPFLDTSFIFPALLNKPIIISTVVYRQRKIFKHKRPYLSLYISNPIFPKLGVSTKENQIYLRDEAYKVMKETVSKYKSYEYIKYALKEHN